MGNARDVALAVLRRVDQDSAFAAAVLAKALPSLGNQRDSAFAFEIVHGVLRRRPWLDHLLRKASNKGLKRIDPEVMRILRIGTYQIVFLSRVPAAAAVSDAVRMVKRSRSARLSGLANALLRRISQMPDVERHPDKIDRQSPLSTLAMAFGFPLWLMERYVEVFGREGALAIAERFNAPSRRTLRVNTHLISVDAVLKQLGGTCYKTPFSPWAVDATDIRRIGPLLEKGEAAHQDEAAQLAVVALDPRPQERILDACAGRGGKSAAIAMATGNRATLTAVDRSQSKLERLAFELERQHLTADTIVQDLTQGTGVVSPGYHRVLLDAPCSGTGTLGRRPEIRWRLVASAIPSLVSTQEKLLDTTAALVAEGGVLLYVVCSILPEEGIGHAARFLAVHPEFSLVKAPPSTWPASIPWNRGCIQINPALTHTDGYQMLVLSKGEKRSGESKMINFVDETRD
jgi:16S rRNA (cytosine967-C5)-methyltransferase